MTTMAVVAGLGLGSIGIGTGLAAPNDVTRHNSSSLIVRIAERFRLPQEDVQAVFDEQRQEMETARQQGQVRRLAALVEDGTLTQAQADALKEKQAEMHAAMESFKDLEPEARQDAMKAQMEQMRSWMQEQGIDFPDRQEGAPHGAKRFGRAGGFERPMMR